MPLLNESRNTARKVNLAVLKRHRFLIGIMLLALALRMLWLKTMIEADEGFFGYDAMLWSKGYLPYVHSSPTKGPLQYLLYLIPIYFFGNTIIPIRIINNILFLISVIVLYMIAKDWYGKRAGLITALFYGIFMNAPVFQAIQAITESTSMPFVIFSIYFCNKYLKNGRKNLLLFSGASMSAALLIRQNQAVGVILLMLMIITQYKFFREDSHAKLLLKNFMISISILIAGVILPILVIIVYFWSIGALYNLIECTVLNYFRFGYFSFPSAPLLSELLMIAEGLPLWLLCFSGFIVCVLRRNKHDVFSIAWLLLFLGIASMPPHFSRHFSPVIAPASVLSAVGLGSVLERIKSSSVREFLRNYKRNITSIFIISLLMFSFVPSIFLQVKQHPNLNFHWNFINAAYFGGAPGQHWSYDRQLELANYLKSHTSENDKILIHDFWATPYWLSGHRAPSKYISTVQIPGIFTITDEEFKRLATMVEDGSFKYIVIFYPLHFPYDSIVYNVLTKYFYVKNIENAHIFSKYNCTGDH